MQKRHKYTSKEVAKLKSEFLELLDKNLGIITPVTKMMHISRDIIIKWRNEDEQFDAAVNAITETTLDFVENALYRKIQEGDTTAIIFYLKTKGKSRGYVEKFDIDATIRRPRIIFEDDGLQTE